MHSKEKLDFNPFSGYKELPDFKLSSVECPRCNCKIPVPPEFVDWKEIANRYKLAYEQMMKHISISMKEAGEQFDVPILEYFEADRLMIISMLEEILNNRKPNA